MKKILITLLLVSIGSVSCLKADEKEHDHKEHAKKEHDHKDHGHGKSGHEAHAGHMLEAYITIATALSKDDLAAAKKAAAKIPEHDEDSSLAKSAEALSTAKDIEAARKEFQTLSKNAIKISKGREGFIVMHCPMVKGGGGDWLQTNKTVANPYMGSKMLNCGGPKK
ncbi:MAG: DUF3347 domain-containing protein [Verrucomicrobiales bacterium]|nr:DUF3347 domain-containing protein [Verrucomicrobiales bacterium]